MRIEANMHSTLAADRAKIADIEAQIQNLRSSIRALRVEKEVLQKRLDAYTYPVLALPNEMLAEIFRHFLPIYPFCPPLVGTLSPMTLTQVCQKWRNVALSTPVLWRAISLNGMVQDHEDVVDDRCEGQISVLKAWLSRSGCLPLSIQAHDFWFCGFLAPGALTALVPHRARWEHVTLEMLPSQLNLLEDSMPCLRHLEIWLGMGNPYPASLQDMPRLRAVTLWDFSYPLHLLPWSQLTSLTLVGQPHHKCTLILKQTPNLVHCMLVLFAWSLDEIEIEPDTQFPFLESLVLVQFTSDEHPATGYLQTLIAPRLRSLQLPESFLGPDPIHTLTVFIKKSGCKLEDVYITGERLLYGRTYRDAFPTILDFAFNRRWMDFYSGEGEPIQAGWGMVDAELPSYPDDE
ncbi:hypothetical protein C8R43DRAFT_1064036 [Mycena crocata]|nr:hypothetical protein C8R43DRAFT_1064036 [Mycena crocata]